MVLKSNKKDISDHCCPGKFS